MVDSEGKVETSHKHTKDATTMKTTIPENDLKTGEETTYT